MVGLRPGAGAGSDCAAAAAFSCAQVWLVVETLAVAVRSSWLFGFGAPMKAETDWKKPTFRAVIRVVF